MLSRETIVHINVCTFMYILMPVSIIKWKRAHFTNKEHESLKSKIFANINEIVGGHIANFQNKIVYQYSPAKKYSVFELFIFL